MRYYIKYFTEIELKDLLPEKKLNIFLKLMKVNYNVYKVFRMKYSEDEVGWKVTFNLILKDNNNFIALGLDEYMDETVNNNYIPITLYSFYYYEPNNTMTKLLNATTIAATMLLNDADGSIILNKLKTISKLYEAFKNYNN